MPKHRAALELRVAFEQRDKAHAVRCGFGLLFNTRQFEQCCIVIGSVNRGIDYHALGNSRAFGNAGDANPALVQIAFVSTERSVVCCRLMATVVGGKKDDGVFAQSFLVKP